MRMNMKVTLVIFIYSLVITCTMVGAFYLWQSSLNRTNVAESMGTSIFVMSEKGESYAVEPSNTAVKTESIMSTTDLDKLYVQSFSKNLPLIVLGTCLIIIVLTVLLWLTLRKLYMKQTISIIEELRLVSPTSETKKLDKGIQQALNSLRTKYENSLEDYKRLSSYMTHDQKNTIAVLKSNLEQIEAGEELLLVNKLTDSVDDIMTLSSDQTGATETVDVALVAAEVCDMYRKIYPAIDFAFAEEDNLEIVGKEGWIYRALCNLLDNAIKYGENQKIEVSVVNKKTSVILSVKDYGRGISEEQQRRIFEHSYRVHGLKQDGYGIGLSVVSHVCNLCRGFAFVESQEEEGSTFYLSFPSADLKPIF